MGSFPLKSKRRSLMIKHWGLHSRKFGIFPQCSIFQTMPNYIIIIRTWSIISSCHVGNFWCMLYYNFLLFSHFLLFFFFIIKNSNALSCSTGVQWFRFSAAKVLEVQFNWAEELQDDSEIFAYFPQHHTPTKVSTK